MADDAASNEMHSELMWKGPAKEASGESIGPYKLLEEIGEGGFGVVWLAERREPMVQRVALKIIKPGMDSREVVGRFELERQALAVMDHPSVAKVFDGGVTPSGRPYFVMEHVRGEPITAYADRNRLSIKERLELFVAVCDAVQHAHTKGIIHRDIKPSNVLVTEVDGKGVPKVIDFGVAKAIGRSMTDGTVFTETGRLIGTPEYMSPEQAELGAVDVDTRTDVYSLGVLLYELLAGAAPFDAKTLRAAGFNKIQRIIREVDPPRPSTRLSGLADAAGAAERRQAQPGELARELSRELEWIPLMALRKDRKQRYQTPRELGEDIERYLEGRPLVAGPESAGYRARKFLKRNKGPAIAGSAVLAALVLGLAATLWMAAEARREAERADERAVAAEKAEAETKQKAEELEQVAAFQEQMLAQVDPTTAGVRLTEDVVRRLDASLEKAGRSEEERKAEIDAFRQQWARVNATDAAAALIDTTILKPAVKAIDEKFKDQPVVDAQLRQAIADRYRDFAIYDEAMRLQQDVIAKRAATLGESHADTLSARNNFGILLWYQGRLDEAEAEYNRVLLVGEITLGEDHPDIVNCLSNLGLLFNDKGKLDEAETIHREVLERSRRSLGPEHPDSVKSLGNLGNVLKDQGRLEEAEAVLRESMQIRKRVLGLADVRTIRSIINYGVVLVSMGDLAGAEQYYREAFELSRSALGEEHIDTIVASSNMGALLRDQGKFEQAEPYQREASDKFAQSLGEDHPYALISLTNLGLLLRDLGRYADAEACLARAMNLRRIKLGDAHSSTLISKTALADLFLATGRHREAVELLVAAMEDARGAFKGTNAPRLALFLNALGRARIGLGFDAEHFAFAESNLLEAHPIFVASRGDAHKDTLECMQAIVDLYTAWHAAEPGKGYDVKAAEWKTKLADAAPQETAAAP